MIRVEEIHPSPGESQTSRRRGLYALCTGSAPQGRHFLRSPYPSGVQNDRPIQTPRTPVVLASGSPRRRALLASAGFSVEVEPADIDDAQVRLGGVPATDVAPALAYFKAQRVASRRAERGAPPAWILAADTVCERDGQVLGKPASAEEAREMIASLERRGHGVVTGWCLLGPDGSRRIGRDTAWIEIGSLERSELDRFVSEGLWQGKAGGYNLPEVVARGWPIECRGDPQTVVGLPIERLAPMLRAAIDAPPEPAR